MAINKIPKMSNSNPPNPVKNKREKALTIYNPARKKLAKIKA
jgi:hypothetical protein